MAKKNPPRIAFFGTSEFVTVILEKLKAADLEPALVISQPATEQGRGLKKTSSPVAVWAEAHEIDVITPETLREIPEELLNSEWDLFIVVSYGLIIPKHILDIPKHGTLNIHPSLLPKLRGPSPYRSAILRDEKDAVGITIILLDEEMDHGPIVAQAKIELLDWPISALTLEALLAEQGGELLAETIRPWLEGAITPESQNHEEATFTKKFKKEDGLIELSGDPYQNYLKICALEGWPGTYFFTKRGDKEIRVKITDAEFIDGALTIREVIPEGKKEMLYEDFKRGLAS